MSETNEHIFWDRFSGRYDSFAKRLSDEYAVLIELIWKELKPEDRVLEVAVGTGNIALEICRTVAKVYGTDISRSMIDIASEKAKNAGVQNVEFFVQDGYSLPFDNDYFDVCIVANALHIMDKPKLCLKEIRRVLKPDGLLIAPTFCDAETLKGRIMSRLLGFFGGILFGFKMPPGFTIESFSDLIERSGFRISKKQTIESIIPLEYLVARPHGEDQNR